MRITDHKRASRRHRKKVQPVVFDSWMSKIVDQKVSEVSNYSFGDDATKDNVPDMNFLFH